MIVYILKSSLSLIILFGLYWFLLRKEKLFEFNRFFLVLSLVFSLLVPFISIPVNFQTTSRLENFIPAYENVIPDISTPDNMVPGDVNISRPNVEKRTSVFNISVILLALYISVVILFLIRFLRNIYIIIQRTKLAEKISFKGYRIVLSNDKTDPCCFFSSIYLNRDDYLNGRIDKELLDHELEHAKQSHTIDILLIELVKIFYWFNPVHILYDRAIRINHEYLADDGVVSEKSDIKSYAEVLLSFITDRRNMSLTSGSNHSFTKMRLMMMMKPGSGSFIYGTRIALTLSMGAVLFLLLSFQEKDKQSLQSSSAQVSNQSEYPQNMVDFSGKWVLNRTQGKTFLTEVASMALIISQDKSSLTLDITITPDNIKPVHRTEKYIYNTSIEKKNTQGDKLTVITCTPSPDGQSFSITETLSYAQNGIEKVTKRVSVYSLGKDGKTLIINQEDFLPEGSITPENERHETRIYDKLN
jgi:beta-lactamase regulating signal transducer with metallopeptidase domain